MSHSRRPFILAAAAALILALGFSWSRTSEPPEPIEIPPILAGAELLLTPAKTLQATVEEPLLREVRSLGRDTRRAALVVFDGLPAPFARLFQPE